MPVIYRTSGTWGSGKGSNLTAAEVDGNFYDLEERIEAIETYGATAETITNVTATGSTVTFFTSLGNEFSVTVSVPRIAALATVDGLTYQPVLTDADKYLRFTNPTGCIFNLPDNDVVAFSIGTEIHLRQTTENGSVEVTSDADVTVNAISGYLPITAVNGAVITCKKIGQNEWDVFGMLTDENSVSA